MVVEADEYELPLAVADSARELGEMVGANKSTVENNAIRQSNGRISGKRYVKVRNEDEWE